MCNKNLWKRIIPFFLAIVIGLLSVRFVNYIPFQNLENSTLPNTKYSCSSNKTNGIGTSGGDYGRNNFDNVASDKLSIFRDSSRNIDFKILSKPRAQYTDLARQNEVMGVIRVRVVFLWTGEIGSVKLLNSLPDGLDEQVLLAVSKIRFQPAVRNGKPINVTKIFEYQFIIF